MFYSATIQRLSEVLLHELSWSASSLFIITTLSFWVVKYWFCSSLCRSHSHNMTSYLLWGDLCGHFERWWLNLKKKKKKTSPSPDCIVYSPHSSVSHIIPNEMPCQDTDRTHPSYVCTCTHMFTSPCVVCHLLDSHVLDIYICWTDLVHSRHVVPSQLEKHRCNW